VDTIVSLVPGFGAVVPYLTALISACAAFAAIAPPPTAQSPVWWVKTYKVINFVGINFGHAKNANQGEHV